MIGASRDSYSGLRAQLDARRTDPALPSLSADLMSAAGVIGSDLGLRSMLADSGQPESARVGTVTSLFQSRLGGLAVEVLSEVVRARWSSPADLLLALDGLTAQAAFLQAEVAGRLEQVEAELFEFDQAVAGSADLQMALTNPAIADSEKSALIHSLLDGRVEPITAEVLANSLAHLRGRRVDAAVGDLIDLASEQMGRSVAEVRVARELDAEQRSRMVAALSQLQGRDVRLNVVVDPTVLGGAMVRIGEVVIDGTVASKLEQARRVISR